MPAAFAKSCPDSMLEVITPDNHVSFISRAERETGVAD